jgi:(4-alkanoyl-5-oxo-2,5-dihydrofuran-3-yl)methyl phosphate reductase
MILITGATGNIGRELVKQLDPRGVPLRVVSRDEAKVATLNQRLERVIGDLRDRATVRRAVSGVERIFMVSLILDGGQQADRLLIEEAQQAGVRHMVKVSTLGARVAVDSPIGRLHREGEQLIEGSGLRWTFLRPGAFMSNTLQWVGTIRSQGAVFNPMGEGKYAPIAPRDIAAVATLALTASGHEGKAYEITGPESLTAREQVRILSEVLGKPIKCIDIPVGVAAERLQKSGASSFLIEGLSYFWNRVKDGSGDFQNDEVERLTGYRAQTFENWCREHRSSLL